MTVEALTTNQMHVTAAEPTPASVHVFLKRNSKYNTSIQGESSHLVPFCKTVPTHWYVLVVYI